MIRNPLTHTALILLALLVPAPPLSADDGFEAHLGRVTAPDFGPDSMPDWLDDRFRGEWALVTLSMTAAAAANRAFHDSREVEASRTALETLAELILDRRFRHFDREAWGEDPLMGLHGDNGHAGYLGHGSLVLGLCRLIGGCQSRMGLHRALVGALLRRLQAVATPLLETYPGEIYVPDNAVILASIQIHDLVEGAEHPKLKARWQTHAEDSLVDEDTGVYSFRAEARGQGKGLSRGSGAAWTLFYIFQYDREVAWKQFEKFRVAFVVPWLLGKAVREYQQETQRAGDVDSGPVMFGLSPSGTAFGIGAARLAGDLELAEGLDRTTRLGLSVVDVVAGKDQLASPTLMDAVLWAMRTAVKWDARFLEEAEP